MDQSSPADLPLTTPWWWQAAPPPAADPAPLPARIDVVIVGGGFTAASAALVLARAGRSVAILEAGQLGAGASSRNGGMIGSGHRVALDGLARQYGADVADALLAEGQQALAFTGELIGREQIDCHYRRCGRFRAAWSPAHYGAMAREAEILRSRFGVRLEMVAAAEQAREIDSPLYHGGCIYLDHGGLHPGLFFSGLLARARDAGALAFDRAEVSGLARDGADWRVHSARGELRAGEVIVATNGYTGSLTPDLMRRLVPLPSYVAATGELDPALLQRLLPGGRMMVETRNRHCYYRRAPDANRLLIGARASVRQLDPAAAAPVMARLLSGIFPQLGEVRFSHVWKGNVAMTRPGLPHLGRRRGLWYALGYSGSGVAMAPYLGYRIAHKLLGQAQGESAFDRIGFAAIPGYTGRPWFLPLLEMRLRWLDRREGSV